MDKSASFTVADWVDYIQTQHWRSMDMTLDRIRAVWEALDGECPGSKVIVAGTNGKGSTVAMLESILGAAGLSSGAYTSPHLVVFNERIRINGQNASDADICQAFREIEAARNGVPLTYFEFGTLCALLVFQKYAVDVVLMEVGLGGRLDAVNMLDGDLAVITSIGLDHQAWLGNDREAIAAEKAGIIRSGCSVVCSDPNMPAAVADRAAELGSPLLLLHRDFMVHQQGGFWTWSANHALLGEPWRSLPELQCPLAGKHQGDNLGGVVAAAAILATTHPITPEHVTQGLPATSLPGRCQIRQQNPLVILDVAHNEDSARELGAFLGANPVAGRTVAVFGALADKDLEAIIRPVVDHIDHWVLAGLQEDRGQTADALAEKMREIFPEISISTRRDPELAWHLARSGLASTDRAVIFGSFHTVGDIIAADFRDLPAQT